MLSSESSFRGQADASGPLKSQGQRVHCLDNELSQRNRKMTHFVIGRQIELEIKIDFLGEEDPRFSLEHFSP